MRLGPLKTREKRLFCLFVFLFEVFVFFNLKKKQSLNLFALANFIYGKRANCALSQICIVKNVNIGKGTNLSFFKPFFGENFIIYTSVT